MYAPGSRGVTVLARHRRSAAASHPSRKRHHDRGHEQRARPPAARHRRVADEGAHHRGLPRRRVRGRGEPRAHPRPAAAERAARGHEEGALRQVRRRRRQRLRGVLRRRQRQEEDGRRPEAGPEGRRRALPRHRRGPRGRGHRLAPAARCSSPRCRCGGWSSTRSPGRRSSAPCRTPATSTSGSSTRRRPGASSTGSTATRSRRCCGARSAPGLSAGRVQSVATRLVVERERERMAFRSASYWDVTGTFARPVRAPGRRQRVPGPSGQPSTVRRVAVGPRLRRPRALTASARSAGRRAPGRGGRDAGWSARSGRRSVRGARRRGEAVHAQPAAPFTTSTLQQEASRKLRFSSRQTMRVAQGLYENGYITYMRTDSVNLSEQALGAARRQAGELYGAGVRAGPAAAVREQDQERAGGARGDPAVGRRLPHARTGLGAAERRRVPPLRAHLEAHGRLPDGRRARLDGHRPAGCRPPPTAATSSSRRRAP